MRQRGAERGDQRPARRRNIEGDAVQSLAPRRGDGGLLAVHPCRRRLSLEIRTGRQPRQRHDDAHGRAGVRRQVQPVAKRRRGVTELVMNLGRARPVRGGEQARNRTRIEREGRDAVRHAQRENLAVGVDLERRAIPFDVTDGAGAAGHVEELGWRVDLERTHRQDEVECQGLAGQIPDLVARDQPGVTA